MYRSYVNKQECVIDTGLSDFHKIFVTYLRSHLNKLEPKIIHYKDWKNFSNVAFRSEFVIENGNLQNYNDLDSFLAKCKDVLNRTVPIKQKHVRANNSPFIKKNILTGTLMQI